MIIKRKKNCLAIGDNFFLNKKRLQLIVIPLVADDLIIISFFINLTLYDFLFLALNSSTNVFLVVDLMIDWKMVLIKKQLV